MVDVRVRLFGHLAVEVDGAWHDGWPRPAARRLVALLALANGHAVSRNSLVEHLFGHQPPDRGRRNASKALSLARTVIGTDSIAADSASLRFVGRVTTDLDDAKQALRKLSDPVEVRSVLASVDDLLLDDRYEEWAQPHFWELEALARHAALELARSTDAEDNVSYVRSGCRSETDAALIPVNQS